MNHNSFPFWSIPLDTVLNQLHTTPGGLSSEEATARLKQTDTQLYKSKKRSSGILLFLSQFKSPIILILLFAAGVSAFLHDPTDAAIILTIVFISGCLGFWQENDAANAVEKLFAMVQAKNEVIRDGKVQEIPSDDIVPGDVLVISAGSRISGDCIILESKDLFVDEAALTGESFPVEKTAGVISANAPLGQRTNTLFLGTHVISGSGKAVAVVTGSKTEFGKISQRLKLRPQETEFERGIRRFGYLLLEITLILVISIFAINVHLQRPALESLLFSLCLAVGLTPQLLPAIISINLAHGAKKMAEKKVIVKKLTSIENFGSMNILCSDKTGTLTKGVVELYSALDYTGKENEKVLSYAYLNSVNETGFMNPIDEAVRRFRKLDVSAYNKLDEVPYDFIRKRLSIFLKTGTSQIMITKGAFQNILDICTSFETPDKKNIRIDTVKHELQERFVSFSTRGYRTLGITYKEISSLSRIDKSDEKDMIFLGFLVFYDPPKEGISDTISELKELGISLKIITGDNRYVAQSIAKQIALPDFNIVTGSQLRQMSDSALVYHVNEITVFAEVEPNQKERIITALKKAGNVVGYMGDGINDATALHVADVGISVDDAVDVAKDAADIVLLEKDLSVIREGVNEGRVTFANTLKYVFMATSANFGNMFSMAGASIFLPFMPLLPKQILFTNLLTDFPEMTIATDSVDNEVLYMPRRWNIKYIRNFMLIFGPLSSIFDFLTFGVLLFMFHSSTVQFRTGWFVESVVSASIIVLVIRSRRPCFKSKPGKYLILSTAAVVLFTVAIPYLPIAKLFGFCKLPVSMLAVLGLIVLMYVVSSEVVKKIFYKKYEQ